MSWPRQVLHVASKDVRRVGWLLALYGLTVAGATAAAVSWRVFADVESSFTRLAVTLLGMVVVGTVVQSDSPSRSDAFWPTRPLYPSAVFTAKLGLILVAVVALPLLGQAAALAAHGPASGEMAGLLVDSAVRFAALIALAGVVAALTRDFRTFAAITIAVLVGSRFLHLLAPVPGVPWSLASTSLPGLGLLVALGFGLVAYLYRTRDVHRARIATIGLAVLTIVLPAVLRDTPVAWARSLTLWGGVSAAEGDVPADVPRPELSIVEFRPQAGSEVTVVVGVDNTAWSHRWQLVQPVLNVRARDGAARLRADYPVIRLDPWGPESAAGAVGELRWLGRPLHRGQSRHGVRFKQSPRESELLADPDVELVITGRVEVREPSRVAILPLARNASVALPGRHVRVTDVLQGPGGPSIELNVTSLSTDGDFPLMGNHLNTGRTLALALVNDVRGEAVPLRNRGGSGRGHSLVLPGPRLGEAEITLAPDPRSGSVREEDLSAEWLSDARIHVIEWAPVGSYRVEIHGGPGTRRPAAGIPIVNPYEPETTGAS